MKHFTYFLAVGMAATCILGATPVFAQSMMATTTRASRGANAVATAKSNADKQITARVDSLNKLSARVQTMIHLTADEKSSISSTVSGDISSLTALQTKIDSDATGSTGSPQATTLKADIQSITKGERIYLLVEPQIMILAAADRAASIGDMFTAFASKVTMRLAATPNASASPLLADLEAKVADAQTQSAAAISETASLQPDNGIASVQASNTAALKDARSKIKTAQSDFKAAYQDAKQIVQAIKETQTTATSTPE